MLDAMTHWHWVIMGMALLVMEIFLPGIIFLWLGLAALVVGGILAIFPDLSWQWQWIGFALFSLLSVVVWHSVLKKNPTPSDRPALNRRGEQYVGRTFVLADAIHQGYGKLRVDDTVWKIRGPDLKIGEQVRVSAVDGVVLIVEAT